ADGSTAFPSRDLFDSPRPNRGSMSDHLRHDAIGTWYYKGEDRHSVARCRGKIPNVCLRRIPGSLQVVGKLLCGTSITMPIRICQFDFVAPTKIYVATEYGNRCSSQ